MRYQRLESDDGYLFEFQLAERLHKTIDEVRAMSHDEFIGWNAYLLRKEQLRQLEHQRLARR